eukprot:3177172-Pyramimonas_sp.AAC.1
MQWGTLQRPLVPAAKRHAAWPPRSGTRASEKTFRRPERQACPRAEANPRVADLHAARRPSPGPDVEHVE